MLSKIKYLTQKIIVPLPVELQEQFDNMQLNNSIRRLRILSLFGFILYIVNPIYYAFAKIQAPVNIFDFLTIGIIILFNLIILIFRKKAEKMFLWIVCYVFTAFSLIFLSSPVFIEINGILPSNIIYLNNINDIENYTNLFVSNLPYLFFLTLSLYTMIPDFKPGVFILYALLYFIITVYTHTFVDVSPDELSFQQAEILNIFIFVLIAKILLYNSKVKTYINTAKINNMNDNLEKMVLDRTKTIVELKNTILQTIAELVEHRDGATGDNITRTSMYLKIIIDTIIERGLYSIQTSSWNTEQMILSSQLHDVGKIAIDDSILRKPGKLKRR